MGNRLSLLVFLMLIACSTAKTDAVCYNGKCFAVEIADDYAERQRGLMFRESLDEDKGMLFIFEEPGIHRFWMKNTLIPLDMVWIDDSGTVVYVSSNTPPCKADPCPSYGPSVNARYVLEINAGLASEISLSQGSIVDIQLAGK
jgi:uncharacterized membrane protein (UPF0127 family)